MEMDPAYFERLEAMLSDFADRILVLESKADIPVTFLDRVRLKGIEQAQERERECRGRRQEAWAKAQAAAESAGHRGPIDGFVRRLKAGEFESCDG
jgi:hypothetical protein